MEGESGKSETRGISVPWKGQQDMKAQRKIEPVTSRSKASGPWLPPMGPATEGNTVLPPCVFRLILGAGGVWPVSESQMAPAVEKQGCKSTNEAQPHTAVAWPGSRSPPPPPGL